MKSKGDKVLERFMREFFPFGEFKKIGFFTKEMKGNFPAQAKRVCDFFGYQTIYEYGAKKISCHISWDQGHWMSVSPQGILEEKPFITEIPGIYENR
jgi:hypothetical protein